MGSSRYHALPEVHLAYRAAPCSFARRLIARRSLLAAQLGIFGQRREWGNAGLAVIASVAKIATDAMGTLRGQK